MVEVRIEKLLDGPTGDMNLQLDLTIEKGTMVTLMGASGAGKTSTLKILAGLLKPEKGYIGLDGEVWLDTAKGHFTKPQRRNIGYVFQDFALFPNMSVKQNLEYGKGKQTDTQFISELLGIMQLENLQNRRPDTLSGGQKQRVALARALVQKPKLLLLDEPLSALDLKTRLGLQDYLQELHHKMGLTTIMVSHDVGEIIKMSHWVYELDQGKILRQGKPKEILGKHNLSGKFRFSGTVLDITQDEVVYVVTVLIQNELVKVIAQESEVVDLNIGDTVIVASKAFNPIIYKVQ